LGKFSLPFDKFADKFAAFHPAQWLPKHEVVGYIASQEGWGNCYFGQPQQSGHNRFGR